MQREIKKGEVIQSVVLGMFIYFSFHFMQSQNVYNALFGGTYSTFDTLRTVMPLSWSKSVVCVLACVVVFFSGLASYKIQTYEKIFAAICSFFMTAGYSIGITGSFFENFLVNENNGGAWEIVYFSFLLVSNYFLAKLILYLVKSGIDKLLERTPESNTRKNASWKDYFIISIAYIVYCIIRYPGGVGYDEALQIKSYLTHNVTSAHWPPASTVFMGAIVSFGERFLGSKDNGIFLLIIVQSLIVAASLAYSLKVMRQFDASRQYILLVRCFYILSPTFFVWTTQGCKDSVYSALVVLFVSLEAEYVFLNKGIAHELIMGVVALVFALMRKNGIYIVYGLMLCFIIYMIKEKKISRFFAVLFIVSVLYVSYTHVLLPALGIGKASIREAFAIPFQQTARTAAKYSDYVTEEERNAIDSVLDYEGIKGSYSPTCVDPVKDYYKEANTSLGNYFRVWGKQFLRYPLTYMDATLVNTYGYFYPDFVHHTLSRDSMYGYDWVREINGDSIYQGYLVEGKIILASYIFVWEYFPIMSMVTNSAILFMVTIYMVLYAIANRRKNKNIIFLLIPSLIGMMVCVAGPTFANHGNRYGLPIAWCAYLLLAICFGTKGREINIVTEIEE